MDGLLWLVQASLLLNKAMFRRLLARFVPALARNTTLDRVFEVMDINGDGEIDFKEFCFGVSRTMRGSFREKLEFVFSLLDPSGACFQAPICPPLHHQYTAAPVLHASLIRVGVGVGVR